MLCNLSAFHFGIHNLYKKVASRDNSNEAKEFPTVNYEPYNFQWQDLLNA